MLQALIPIPLVRHEVEFSNLEASKKRFHFRTPEKEGLRNLLSLATPLRSLAVLRRSATLDSTFLEIKRSFPRREMSFF
jgi:hypothetical protein